MILQFWRSEGPRKSHWTKIKVSAGLLPPGGSRGEIHFLALSIFQRTPAFLDGDSSSVSTGNNIGQSLPHAAVSLILPLLPPFFAL